MSPEKHRHLSPAIHQVEKDDTPGVIFPPDICKTFVAMKENMSPLPEAIKVTVSDRDKEG